MLRIRRDERRELLVALRALTAELRRQNDMAERQFGVSTRTATKAMADLISGQLGRGIGGAGGSARY